MAAWLKKSGRIAALAASRRVDLMIVFLFMSIGRVVRQTG
jgi:hypothetical protein